MGLNHVRFFKETAFSTATKWALPMRLSSDRITGILSLEARDSPNPESQATKYSLLPPTTTPPPSSTASSQPPPPISPAPPPPSSLLSPTSSIFSPPSTLLSPPSQDPYLQQTPPPPLSSSTRSDSNYPPLDELMHLSA